MSKMNEIRIKIPKEIPFPSLKGKIDELIKEGEVKCALFEKCKEEISLTEEELNEPEKAWKETKKNTDCSRYQCADLCSDKK